MTDLDPAIWDNPTLGAASPNERLDRLEKQQKEDRNAKIEGRQPREVVVDNTYPGWTPPVSDRTGTVPSGLEVVHFANDVSNGEPPIVETPDTPDPEPEGDGPDFDSSGSIEEGEGEPTKWT